MRVIVGRMFGAVVVEEGDVVTEDAAVMVGAMLGRVANGIGANGGR